jgi:hypothetical protein
MPKATFFQTIFCILLFICNPLNAVEQELADHLKKNSFNLEIFELAFCLPEILSIIESEPETYEVLEKRINRSFSQETNENTRFIFSMEYKFLQKMLQENQLLKKEFPIGFQKLSKLKPSLIDSPPASFSNIFNSYIEFPEQVDNICLILLTANEDCRAFQEIENNRDANWKFSNWLEYGFDEFRFFPGTLDKAKGILNDRIINYILENPVCHDQPLVKRSVDMISLFQK